MTLPVATLQTSRALSIFKIVPNAWEMIQKYDGMFWRGGRAHERLCKHGTEYSKKNGFPFRNHDSEETVKDAMASPESPAGRLVPTRGSLLAEPPPQPESLEALGVAGVSGHGLGSPRSPWDPKEGARGVSLSLWLSPLLLVLCVLESYWSGIFYLV